MIKLAKKHHVVKYYLSNGASIAMVVEDGEELSSIKYISNFGDLLVEFRVEYGSYVDTVEGYHKAVKILEREYKTKASRGDGYVYVQMCKGRQITVPNRWSWSDVALIGIATAGLVLAVWS